MLKLNTKRVIAYCRYSPRPKDSDSISAQAADINVWCEDHDLEVDVFCFDAATSGTVPLFKRPGLATAFAQLSRGDILIVRNLNRAARSLAAGIVIDEEVDRVGARLVSVEDGGYQARKSDDRNAWGMRMIQFLFADLARMETCDRTSRKMLMHQAAGRAMGGAPPYGMRKVGMAGGEGGARLVEDETEQAIIADVDEMTGDGYTPNEIAAKFNRDEVPARGKRWHANTVRRIRDR